MSPTWILVAESSRAKLYSRENRKAPLTEVESLVHPEGRMHEGDLVADRAGSDGGSVGQGRHIVVNRTSAKEQECIDFARTLGHRLESARNNGSFNKLILIAPPAFLGVLRDQLSKEVMNRVSEQIDKNLVQQSAAVVQSHLSTARVW